MKLVRTPVLAALLLLAVACDDDGVEPTPTFDVTFTGDATFQGAHGGQDVEVAIVAADGTVLDTDAGTVSATADPAFSFTFADVVQEGDTYELHYWIDSNFGGGTAGTCDPPANDHQWSIAISAVTADATIDDVHRPGETSSVCDSF